MSDEFSNNPEENPQIKKTVKKIVKKRNVSQYASGTPAQSGYGGYGNYGGYGYGSYGGYGNYGGYGYGGYGYGGYGQQQSQPPVANRTIGDYLHILRERIWFIIITFIIIFAGVALYTIRATPVYTSTASLRILRAQDNPITGGAQTRDNQIANTEDLNTQVRLLNSVEVMNHVKKQLKDDEKARLMAPYRDAFSLVTITEETVLMENKNIYPMRMSLIVNIEFSHPDKDLAARIANLYASEFISFSQQTNARELLTMIDNLHERVKTQDTKVKDLESRLVEFRTTKDGISLDQRLDLMATELSMLTSSLVNAKQALDSTQTNWRMIQDYQKEGKNLWNIPFVANNARVMQLIPQRSSLMIDKATLEKRYKDKHPVMIELNRKLEELEKELSAALESAAAEAKAMYETAQDNYEQIQKNLEDKKQERLTLFQKSIDYKAIEREKIAAESLHFELASQMNKRLAEVSLIPPSARQVDYAGAALQPSSPNYILNTIIGILGGLVGGTMVAFIVAFIDDRVKSAHDIEAIIGLPLLGAIPRIKKLNSSEKAQVAASNTDRGAAEAFRAILSSIKLSHIGKTAKIILSTSTTPSEGKSFVLSNIAFTSAVHGEKVLVIDADLRLPAVAKILGIESNKGLIAYTEGRASIDECIVREYFPNMDVLPCEKRVSNPTQILNSDAFIGMLQDLREQYDKIYIDTPPIGAVSDAIGLLPYVDGIIYVIKYNAIKRKIIKGYVKKLLDSNVPILGAVMNMVNPTSSQSYTSNYYNKSYKNYYLAGEDDFEEGAEDESTPPQAS